MNIMKIILLPKAICRLNEISIKFPMVFLTELEQKFHNLAWKHKRPQILANLEKRKNGAEGISFPDLRLYYKTDN